MNKNWCLYKHTNKLNGKSYIGITSRSPEVRWGKDGSHYRDSQSKYYSFYNAIQKYGWDNFTHEILLTNLSAEEACLKEQEYIKIYNSKAPYGYNLTDGGEGTSGYQATLEFCKRRSELTTGKNNPTAKQVFYGGQIFDAVNDCAQYLGVDRNKIMRWVTGKTYIPEIHKQNNLHIVGETPNYKLGKRGDNNGRKVFYNGKVYKSIGECATYLGVCKNTLSSWLTGEVGLRKDK